MNTSIVEIIKDLPQYIEAKNAMQTREILNELHPADIAEFLNEYSLEDQVFILNCIENEVSANVILELEDDERKDLLKQYSAKEIAEDIIDEMDSDDATDVISELSDARKNDVISQIEDEEQAKNIVDLLKYDEDTAGGIMAKEMVKLDKNLNVISAVKQMRKQAEELEEVYSIYVVDEKDRLLGILNLKKLLTTSATSKLENVYNPKVYSVLVTDSTEEVARLMQKYDLFEIPVVDELKRLVGRITIDDVMDMIEERDTEDIHKFGGTDGLDVSYTKTTLMELVKKRAGWLVLLLLGEMLTASAMSYFQTALDKAMVLAIFIPLIISSGGNSGSQAASLIIRAMALKELQLNDWWYVMKKEILSGLILGAILGIIGFLRILIWQKLGFFDYTIHWALVGATVSFSLMFIVLWGTLSGSLIPFALKRFGLDPATASAPFVATLVDVTGLIIYFSFAALFLSGTLLK